MSKAAFINPVMDRRQMLLGGVALGASAGLRPAFAQSGPKRGGTLRMALGHGNTSDSYDPATWDNGFVQAFAMTRHNYLTEVAPDGNLVPEVAEEWSASGDARVWTFKIRQGIEFHDGRSVRPADVAASINYHRGPDSTSGAKPIVEEIETIETGEGMVRFTLSSGNADFPFVLSDFHLPIMPATDGEIDPESPIGCGGYMVESYQPGVNARLTRNPNYWKTDRAFFDAIDILSVVDPAARQNALMSGEVDAIDRVELSTVHLLRREQGVEILTTQGTQHFVFAMDTRTAPFDNNDVRMALKYAVDREEMVDKILFGFGRVGNDQPVPSSDRFYAEDLEQVVYDPERAKYHLKQAGLDRLPVTLSTSEAAFAGAVDAATLYSESARPAGIDLTASREPSDGYFSDVWMKDPFVASYWQGRPTADWMFTTAYAAGVPWNESYWDNARFNTLLTEARAELDETRRTEMYAEMQRIVKNQGGTVIPMFADYVMAHSDRVALPEVVASNWSMDGFRAAERWWFA